MQFDETVIDKLTEPGPQSNGVVNGTKQRSRGSSKGLLVEPYFEFINDRFRKPSAQFNALVFRQGECVVVDEEEALDDTKRIVSEFLFGMFGVFKVSVNVSPASCGCGGVSVLVFCFQGVIILGGAIGQKEAEKIGQEISCCLALPIFGKFVDVVWMLIVAAEMPHAASLSFTAAALKKRHRGIVTEDDTAFEYFLAHHFVENRKLVGALFEPARQRRAGYAPAFNVEEYFEHLFLPVERKMVSHFRNNDMGKEFWTRIAFVDWLIWLGSGHDTAFTMIARILILDVFDTFEPSWNVFELVGDIKAERSARQVAAGAEEIRSFKLVFQRDFVIDEKRYTSAAATVNSFGLGRFSVFDTFVIERILCLVVEVFTRAFEVIGGGLSRAWAKLIAAAPSVGVLHLHYQLGQNENQRMGRFHCRWERIGQGKLLELRAGAIFGHIICSPRRCHYIIQ